MVKQHFGQYIMKIVLKLEVLKFCNMNNSFISWITKYSFSEISAVSFDMFTFLLRK